MSMHNQNMQNITFANTEPRGDIPISYIRNGNKTVGNLNPKLTPQFAYELLPQLLLKLLC